MSLVFSVSYCAYPNMVALDQCILICVCIGHLGWMSLSLCVLHARMALDQLSLYVRSLLFSASQECIESVRPHCLVNDVECA